MYLLPHPLTILHSQPSKAAFKKLAKSHVLDYWEKLLRAEANQLTSLKFFNPAFMSLDSPHPLWLTAGSNPYEVNKATIQARMLSGRYRSESVCRHWSSNKAGLCLLPNCSSTEKIEDIPHILISCPSLTTIRSKMIKFFSDFSAKLQYPAAVIIDRFLSSNDVIFQTQFLLDCSTLPGVISCQQLYGDKVLYDLFYI